jgi:G3E family GTPase
MIMQAAPGADATLIPVSLLTGFLGSGKTTLLGKLLRSAQLADTAVIINEFGEIGIDHHLVEAVDGETVVMDGGCICCTVRDDLAATLTGLRAKSLAGTIPLFRRVVIETTGLADPAPILQTLMTDPRLAQFFYLDGVITTVDAVNGAGQLDTQPESVKQAAVADRIVLTKTDLASAAQVALLQERLARLNPGAPVIAAVGGATEAAALFGAALYDPHTKTMDVQAWLRDEAHRAAQDAAHDGSHQPAPHGPQHQCGDDCGHAAHRNGNRHDAGIRSHVLTLDTPLEWQVVSDWLGGLAFFHGAKLLRMKGILNVRDEAGPVAVHVVQHLFHTPTALHAWPDQDRRSRLVFITRDLPAHVIDDALARAQASLQPIPQPVECD